MKRAVGPADNEVPVFVSNLWTNRLIGDEHLPPKGDYGKAGPKRD